MLIRRPGQPWHALQPALHDERALQTLLVQSPGLLPSSGPGELALAPNFRAGSTGSVDLLGVGPDGRIVLVECGRQEGPGRRPMGGAALAVAAALWRAPYEDFERAFATRAGAPLAERVAAAARAAGVSFDETGLEQAVTGNLVAGRFQLILAVDTITDEVRRVVAYLNSGTRAGLTAVALGLRYLAEEGVEILFPTVYRGDAATAEAFVPPVAEAPGTSQSSRGPSAGPASATHTPPAQTATSIRPAARPAAPASSPSGPASAPASTAPSVPAPPSRAAGSGPAAHGAAGGAAAPAGAGPAAAAPSAPAAGGAAAPADAGPAAAAPSAPADAGPAAAAPSAPADAGPASEAPSAPASGATAAPAPSSAPPGPAGPAVSATAPPSTRTGRGRSAAPATPSAPAPAEAIPAVPLASAPVTAAGSPATAPPAPAEAIPAVAVPPAPAAPPASPAAAPAEATPGAAAPPAPAGANQGEPALFAALSAACLPPAVDAVRRLYQIARERGKELQWGQGDHPAVTAVFDIGGRPVGVWSCYTDLKPSFVINFEWLAPHVPPERLQRLADRLGQLPSVPERLSGLAEAGYRRRLALAVNAVLAQPGAADVIASALGELLDGVGATVPSGTSTAAPPASGRAAAR